MKITATTKYGGSAKENRDGFKIEAEAEISEKQLNELAAIGLASVLYRAGAGAMNKALKVESNSLTEFSDEAAAKLSVALGEWAEDEKESPLTDGFALNTAITRHVHGESAETKFAAERRIYVAKKEKLDKLAALVNYDGELGDGSSDGAPEAFLQAIRNWTRTA